MFCATLQVTTSLTQVKGDPTITVILCTLLFTTLCILLPSLYTRWYQGSRVSASNTSDSIVKPHLDRPDASYVTRGVAGLVGPITGPQAVQFASEPQPLLTSPSDLGDLGRAAGLWPEASEGGSIPSQVHKSNRTHRVRYVSDSGNLVTIDSESSSSGEHDDRSTSLEQQSRDDDDVESDVSGSPNGSNAAPESPIDMQDNSVPLARVDDGCPVVSTEVEDANSVTPDDTDSYGFRVTVYTEPGAVALHDGNLDMTVYEVNDSDVVSDTRPVYEDSDVDSMAATDDESACGTMPPNGGDFDIAANEVDDMLSDAYSESVVEADDILSDTQSVSGVSDTSSWITTDDSAADCSSPDVESDSSAWITTDDSVPDDSDLGSPITTKTGPLPAGSDAPSLAHSHSGIFGEDDLSHSAASSSRDTTSRLEELNSPALSELADDICAHLDFLLQPTGPDSVEDETLQRMPPSTSVVSSLSTSGRDWEPAAPGFVFSVGAPVPSTSSPTLSTSRLPSLRSPSASDGHAALGNSQDQRDGTPRSSASGSSLGESSSSSTSPPLGRGAFRTQYIGPAKLRTAFRHRLARLAQARPDELVSGVAVAGEVPGGSFASHRRLVTA